MVSPITFSLTVSLRFSNFCANLDPLELIVANMPKRANKEVLGHRCCHNLNTGRLVMASKFNISILFLVVIIYQIRLSNHGILCFNHEQPQSSPKTQSFRHHHQHDHQHYHNKANGEQIRLAETISVVAQTVDVDSTSSELVPLMTEKHRTTSGRNSFASRTHKHNQTTIHSQGDGANEETRKTRAVYLAVDDSRSSVSTQNNSSGGPLPWPHQFYQNDQPPILDQCCACDEAKYELVFEGLWSRYTHPDDFPENYWLAHFSDIIGASHSNEFRMWNYGSLATEGVKELAETGSTKKLESELKQVSSKTRTIIKARELRYPTLNSKTSAVFRTDRQHHLVSILSKLGPSPDWMVGVSGLELCQTDCSWATQRVVNLYLWDAGTDSGTYFTAPDLPTRPQDKIHQFKKVQILNLSTNSSAQRNSNFGGSQADFNINYDMSSQPIHRRQALFEQRDGNGNELISQINQKESTLAQVPATSSSFGNEQSKPFARLTITRQRIYEKSCNGDSIPPPKQSTYQTVGSDSWLEPTRPIYSDCRFTDWSDWSTCSSKCGKGIRTRTRSFIDEQAHLISCSQVNLIEKELCLSECIGNTTCVTRDWSGWSKCSVTCGQGYRKRTRAPIGPMRRACESVELVEIEPCSEGQSTNCTQDPSPCEVTEWSQWSDCSVACGKGTRIRTRQYIRKDNIENCTARLFQKQSCTGRPELCKQSSNKDICTQPLEFGPCKAKITRWYYEKTSGMCVKFDYGGCLGNANNFYSFQDCERNCHFMRTGSQSVVKAALRRKL